MKTLKGILAVSLLLLAASTGALTFQEFDREGETGFRSLNIPAGGRCESLGGACTALADELTFFDYNPAASALLEQTEVAFFHNAWIADSALETLAASTRFGNLGLGAALKCFYVPFTEYDYFGQREAGSYYSESCLTLNAAYTFFAGYDFKGITVGGNFKAAWRAMPDYADSQTGSLAGGSGLSQSALAVMGDGGVLVRFNAAKFYSSREANLHLACSIHNLGAAFTGFGKKLVKDDPLPSRISAGLAYRPLAALLITAEYRRYISLSDTIEASSWAAGGGAELYLTSRFALSGGFLLQSGSPRISMGSSFPVRVAIMHVNYTFDITSSLNPVNHISLSAKVRLGDKGRAEKARAVDAHYIQGLTLYAEGTRDSIEKAILEWEEALRLDKSFNPARDAKKAAEEMLAAHDAITSLGKLQTK